MELEQAKAAVQQWAAGYQQRNGSFADIERRLSGVQPTLRELQNSAV